MNNNPVNRQQRRHGAHPLPKGPSVFLAWPDDGETVGQFTASLVAMFITNRFAKAAIGERGAYGRFESSPRISEARTVIVDQLLASRCEWLWTLDSDMAFAPDTLERLMAVASKEQQPIVGGLCFAGARDGCEPYPTMWVMHDTDEGAARPEIVWDWPTGRVVHVDATGGACLLVHRSVFEKMAEHFPRPYPWFAETFIDEHQIGEDTTFCLRARQLGFPVAVHTGVEIGHVNLHTVGLADYQRITAPRHVRSGHTQEEHTVTRAEAARAQEAADGQSGGAVPLRQ